LRILGVRVEPLTEADAVTAARLWTSTCAAGLPLADRCCLALAARLDLTTVTADTAWAALDVDIPIQIIS
jgi:ribonuclease VapC